MECEVWEVCDGEEDAGEGGQKDCRTEWVVEMERDCEEGEEEGGALLLNVLSFPLTLALLLTSP